MLGDRKDTLGLIVEGLSSVNESKNKLWYISGKGKGDWVFQYILNTSNLNKFKKRGSKTSYKIETEVELDKNSYYTYACKIKQAIQDNDLNNPTYNCTVGEFGSDYYGFAWSRSDKEDYFEGLDEGVQGKITLEKVKLEDYIIKNYKNLIKNKNIFTFVKDFYYGTVKMFDGDSPALVAFYNTGCVKGDKIVIPKNTKFFMSAWDRMEGPVFNLIGNEDAEFGIMDFDDVFASIEGAIYDVNEEAMFEGKKLSNEQIKWLFANGAAVSKGDTIEIDWDKANKAGWRKKLGGPEAKTPEEKPSEKESSSKYASRLNSDSSLNLSEEERAVAEKISNTVAEISNKSYRTRGYGAPWNKALEVVGKEMAPALRESLGISSFGDSEINHDADWFFERFDDKDMAEKDLRKNLKKNGKEDLIEKASKRKDELSKIILDAVENFNKAGGGSETIPLCKDEKELKKITDTLVKRTGYKFVWTAGMQEYQDIMNGTWPDGKGIYY